MSARNQKLKQRIAGMVRRAPLLAKVMTAIYRLTRPRFTAGVVGVVINDSNQVLLVEHVYHPDEPWGLPGGWLERNEPPAEGVRREIREETGMDVQILAPLLIDQQYFRADHLDIAFLCKPRTEVINLSEELLSFEWVNIHNIRPLKPFHKAAIRVALERQADGD